MDMEYMLEIQAGMLAAQAKQELESCNAAGAAYGLVLTEEEFTELTACRAQALAAAGRIEFGGGVLPKLAYAFCDSPYIDRANYKDTLAELQEAFYYFKSEAMDRIADDELIDFMAKVFNGRAQGSVEYLAGTSLEALCRYARGNWDRFDAGESGDLF